MLSCIFTLPSIIFMFRQLELEIFISTGTRFNDRGRLPGFQEAGSGEKLEEGHNKGRTGDMAPYCRTPASTHCQRLKVGIVDLEIKLQSTSQQVRNCSSQIPLDGRVSRVPLPGTWQFQHLFVYLIHAIHIMAFEFL